MNKIKNIYINLAIILLLVWATFMLYSKASNEINEIEQKAFENSLIAFNLTKVKIEAYLNHLQDVITIESYRKSDSLRKIFIDPDENADLLESIQEEIQNTLPNAVLSTLADDNGEPLLPDYDGFIGNNCKMNINHFAKNNIFEIRVHPNNFQYHFDIMVHYYDPKKLFSGIFYTSFKTTHLQEILAQGETEQNQLLLTFNAVPGLIEVSSQGNRLQMKRETKLNENELLRISVSQKISNTSWSLASLPPLHIALDKKNRIVSITIIEILFLYLITSILFYIIYKEIKVRQRISDRYQLFLDKTEIGFMVFNENKQIEFVNNALLHLAEMTSTKTMLGTPISRWIQEKPLIKINQAIESAEKTGQLIGLQIEREHSSGKMQQFIIDILKDEKSKTPSYAFFCKDISHIYELEKINQEKQAAILSDQSKSAFLANISHELRTPLHGILSYASMGIKRVNSVSTEKLEKYFTNIHISGKRLLGLVNDLLDLSKLEAGQMEMSYTSANLLMVTENTIVEQQSKLDERHLQLSINNTIDKKSIYNAIDLDLLYITQVIANLLSNAIKFTPEKGRISITLEEDNLKLDKHKAVHAISFSIKNQGEGIPEADLEMIFEKFKQSGAKDTETGTGKGSTGLGLAICKELVHAHGGIISAKSIRGVDATFRFTIPLVREEEEKEKKV